mmetsp:Transcript_88774/g.286894  ORF Transcript_88774/g.286894 Transcript_88774/m.286894 type:complete len:570 (+) Transcript_88774:123-1832(+)
MGLCGGKSASETYRKEEGDAKAADRSACSAERPREESASSVQRIHSESAASRPGDAMCVMLSTVAMETSFRRMRLIHHTVGDIGSFYDLDTNKLGQGAFGYVCVGVSQETGMSRAIKSMSKARAKDTRKRYRQEILIMKMTDHPNIIKLYETFEDKNHLFLVMELCTGGDLFNRLQTQGCFEERDAAILMQQILRPLNYMHSKMICHRDIKPENFLFLNQAPVAQNTLKIIDFGFSCTFKEGQLLTTKLGTPAYSSPQVFAGQYDQSCDLWSVGAMLYVLLSGQPPFQGRTDAEVIQNVKRGNYAFKGATWDVVGDVAKDMVRRMLKFNPQERASAQQALQHVYIRDSGEHEGSLAMMLTTSLVMDLRSFCSQSLLRRAALQVVAMQLLQEETESLRRAFEALDSRGAGVLTVTELKASMDGHEIGDLRPEFDQVVKELSTFDSEGRGDDTEIGFTDFLAATLEAKHFQKVGACRAAFRAFDRDGDGRITALELEHVLMGGTYTSEGGSRCGGGGGDDDWGDISPSGSRRTSKGLEIRNLIRGVDANGDGVIDFSEFKVMLQGDTISAV